MPKTIFVRIELCVRALLASSEKVLTNGKARSLELLEEDSDVGLFIFLYLNK